MYGMLNRPPLFVSSALIEDSIFRFASLDDNYCRVLERANNVINIHYEVIWIQQSH